MKQETPGTNCIQDRLNELKARYGTQQAFAEAIGVTRNAVSPWLNGDKMPSAAVIADICTACHVSPNWLFGIDDNIPLSLAALDNIRDCGKELTKNRNGANDGINNKPYTGTDYEGMRALIDRLLCMEWFYLAIRDLYGSIQYENSFNTGKEINKLPSEYNREFANSRMFMAEQKITDCFAQIQALETRQPKR